MTAYYVFIDDWLKAHRAQAYWRRSPDDTPAFTNVELAEVVW